MAIRFWLLIASMELLNAADTRWFWGSAMRKPPPAVIAFIRVDRLV
ncbi:MAG: hypothetical protein PUP92_05965 [Rhizonema sp. PD38]|nr:hypothetical protein [Rhizonema sp. PD38]